MTRLFLFLALCALAFVSVAQENANKSYVIFKPNDGKLQVSYYLNEKGKVFDKFQDAMRAGSIIRIEHQLSFMPKAEGWASSWLPAWGNTHLADLVYTRYLKYDPLEDKYALSENPTNLETTLTKEDAAKAVFSVYQLNLLKDTAALRQGKEYNLRIKIRFAEPEEDESLLGYLSLQNLWEPQTMEAEVTYIAQ